jgi:predicted nucleic acid-binding protein
MCRVKVLDTGVLIGIAVAQDQHHQNCIEYVTNSDDDTYAPPTVIYEFKDKLGEIRTNLHRVILKHRKSVIKHIGDTELDRTDLVKIREDILDTDINAHRFLFEFYEEIAKDGKIERDTLTDLLSDMATEVHDDGASEYGGFSSLVSAWTKDVETYPNVENELLICEGDDPDVCIEAHHIAEERDEDTELGTTNPRHFIRKQDGEPETRKENILRITSLADVVDLSMGKYP